MPFTLTSPAFATGARIPGRFTCDGADVSPALAWSGAPEGTRSFALICADPDAPAGTWYHWAIYDLPATQDCLDEHWSAAGGPIKQAVNDFGRTGYGGPCPPHGHGTHHYRFRLYALDIEALKPHRRSCRDIERATTDHTLASAELVGLYSR